MGRVFVADSNNCSIRQITLATGQVSTLAGKSGVCAYANSSDGTGATAKFRTPYGISYSAPSGSYSQGRLFVADTNNHTIRQIDVATGATTTLAGAAGAIGSADSSNGTGATARFNYPRGISYSAPDAVYSQGRLFVADSNNQTIRSVDVATGATTTLAGAAGVAGNNNSSDGTGATARFYYPSGISYSAPSGSYSQGRLFVVDSSNHTIRSVDVATGATTTLAGVAGSSGSDNSSDGTGATAKFYYPRGISYSVPDAVYTQGRLFVADSYNHTIRQIDVATGATTTLAGVAGWQGSDNSSDGTGATAKFYYPYGISYSAPDAVYSQGRLFVADTSNHSIRQIDVATGNTSTVLGQAGQRGFSPGAAPGVLNNPMGVAVSGNTLYITMQNGVVQAVPLP